MNFSKEQLEAGQMILVDKPLQWTSFAVIQKLRYLFQIRKIGHAGTLDPLATGILIVCTGKFTKKINEFMAQEKEYKGTFTLGATTPTYDLESEPVDFKSYDKLLSKDIIEATQLFTGPIQQVPPAHSAIKVGGKRVYEMARKGIDVKLEPRNVTISEFSIEKIELPVVYFKVVCSTGTYIRSLAHDFGKQLGCGAYLSKLCRTRIGDFKLEDAHSIDEISQRVERRS